MSFTLVFQHPHKYASYLMGYEPCPIFKIPGKEDFVPEPSSPQYVKGSIYKLLEDLTNLERKCVIIVHPDGYGNNEDLLTLYSDLVEKNYIIHLFICKQASWLAFFICSTTLLFFLVNKNHLGKGPPGTVFLMVISKSHFYQCHNLRV